MVKCVYSFFVAKEHHNLIECCTFSSSGLLCWSNLLEFCNEGDVHGRPE